MSGRPRAPGDGVLRLRLYVAGDAPNSAAALRSLRGLLAVRPSTPVELEIVDLLKEPERGLGDGVIVTPTLIKLAPGLERRLVGSLGDSRALLATLDLHEDD